MPSLEIALTFKNLFFEHQDDIRIYTIYFSEAEANDLISAFENDNFNNGNFALRHNLLKQIEEVENANEKFLGFDCIGVEIDGSFHSLYCHDGTETLTRKFNVETNEFGLFGDLADRQAIMNYLSMPEARVEPVPWYIVKTKRIKIDVWQ